MVAAVLRAPGPGKNSRLVGAINEMKSGCENRVLEDLGHA